jgi:hypothetical protein
MADYDYRAGKQRIIEILNNKLEVLNGSRLPSIEELTFDNSYYSWVTAVFVDIRDSTSLFTDKNKIKVSKIIRSFTSEIIEILRDDKNLREIGIRGDCVYSIYTTPLKSDIFEITDKTFYINTCIKMLNEFFNSKNYPVISVGVGMSTAQELIIKAGRKGVDIKNTVWIGDAVTKASNLSSLGSKNGIGSLVYSASSYSNFIDIFIKRNGKKATELFKKIYHSDYGFYYQANIIKIEFDKWISNGMKD